MGPGLYVENQTALFFIKGVGPSRSVAGRRHGWSMPIFFIFYDLAAAKLAAVIKLPVTSANYGGLGSSKSPPTSANCEAFGSSKFSLTSANCEAFGSSKLPLTSANCEAFGSNKL